MFVPHEGLKKLPVKVEEENRYTDDFGVVAQRMSHLIGENVLYPELRE